MAKDNSYLTSFKIDLVRQAMEGHELKAVAQKYGVSKSTLWGWKCKYGQMVCSEWARKEPTRMSDGDCADVVAPATQSKADSNDFIGVVEPFRRNFGRYPANVCADAGYGLPPSTSRVRSSRSLRRNGCPKREGGSTLIPTKNRNVRSMLRNLSRYRERGVNQPIGFSTAPFRSLHNIATFRTDCVCLDLSVLS